jgi:hypothetical protein
MSAEFRRWLGQTQLNQVWDNHAVADDFDNSTEAGRQLRRDWVNRIFANTDYSPRSREEILTRFDSPNHQTVKKWIQFVFQASLRLNNPEDRSKSMPPF